MIHRIMGIDVGERNGRGRHGKQYTADGGSYDEFHFVYPLIVDWN